jgi:hypothetical protein
MHATQAQHMMGLGYPPSGDRFRSGNEAETRPRVGSPQLIAIDDRARIARHVIENAALDERVHSRVAEEDERGAIVVAARVTGDLPPLREQLIDRQRRRLGGRDAGRRKDHGEKEARAHARISRCARARLLLSMRIPRFAQIRACNRRRRPAIALGGAKVRGSTASLAPMHPARNSRLLYRPLCWQPSWQETTTA